MLCLIPNRSPALPAEVALLAVKDPIQGTIARKRSLQGTRSYPHRHVRRCFYSRNIEVVTGRKLRREGLSGGQARWLKEVDRGDFSSPDWQVSLLCRSLRLVRIAGSDPRGNSYAKFLQGLAKNGLVQLHFG